MNALPTWFRAAIITSAQTAGAVIVLAVGDLLFDVQDWIADPTNPVDVSGTGKLIAGAIVTGLAGIVTAVYRKIKPPESSYTPPPGG